MEDTSSETNQVQHRKASSISGKPVEGANRKPASIYEINDLYNALQDLVHSSPSIEHRRVRTTTSTLDSSDGTSGTDSPDLINKYSRRNTATRVIRSSSSITMRYPSPTSRRAERQPKMSTPELKYKKLSNQRPPIGMENEAKNISPKTRLKKSKSDAPRSRSKSSLYNGGKSMADKIREERLRFTDGLKRREKEDSKECVIEGMPVKSIDDLLEMAKWSPKQNARKKKKKGPRKRVSSFLNSEKKLKQNFSDSNLRSMEISSRLNEWYEKASSQALAQADELSFESSSGSESDEESNDETEGRQGKMEDYDMKPNVLNPDEIIKKWMGQKKKSLINEERGRSSSETSQSADEMSQSNSPIIESPNDHSDHSNQNDHPTSIIISQASIDNNNDNQDNTSLPNQPIFYIPNISSDEGSKPSPTIIHGKDSKKSKNINNNSLLTPSRPRSRSAISSGDTFERENDQSLQILKSEKKSRSLGLYRRGSVDTTERENHKETKERLLRSTSEYRRSPRPRSLNLSSDVKFDDKRHAQDTAVKKLPMDDASNYIAMKTAPKHEKTKKLSKFPGKLKSLLSGKKT